MRHYQRVFIVLAGIFITVAYQNCADDFSLERFEQASLAEPVNGNAKEVAEDIFGHLSTDSVAQATLSDTQNDSTFGCLYKPGQTCLTGSAISRQVSRIYASENSFYLDNLTSPHRGLDNEGRPCNTFMNFNGNMGLNDPNCQVRVELFWEPICAGGGFNCANSNLVHKFKFKYIEFVLARASTVVQTEELSPNSQLFAYKTFTDLEGAGIYLRQQTSATSGATNVAKYQSCMGSLTHSSTNMNCTCGASQTKDVDNALKCVTTTRTCSVANAATCTETYNAATNTYAISTLTCVAGYKRSGNTCILDNGKWVMYGLNSAGFSALNCSQFYTISFGSPSAYPKENDTCNPVGRVQCYGFVASAPLTKFKCQ
jgi:hypothetical protein